MKTSSGDKRRIARFFSNGQARSTGASAAMSVLGAFLFFVCVIAIMHTSAYAGTGVIAAAATAAAPTVSRGTLLRRMGRDQGPEYEQTNAQSGSSGAGAVGLVQGTVSLKTDKKIKWYQLICRIRLTNGGTGPTLRTAPPLLNTQVFALLQQITVRGTHLKIGTQTVFQMNGEDAAEWMAMMFPNYVPFWKIGKNGAAPIVGTALDTTASHTNDIEFSLPIPMFPIGVTDGDMPLYCLHGPDWPGNLYMDITWADGTAVATANAPTCAAINGTTGTGSVYIHSVRPNLGKDLASKVQPGVTFRISQTGQATNIVANTSGTGIKIADLRVGQGDTTRILLKTGTLASGATSGVSCYGSLLDSIVTRTFFSLDGRPLRFQQYDSALQDYMGLASGRQQQIGYKLIDFIMGEQHSPAIAQMAFASSQLTASRTFELDGDVTAASGQIATVTQERVYGAPRLIQ